jgi:small-conductance mechanosensitive channel
LLVVVVVAVLVVMGRPLMENIGASVVLQAEAPFQIGDIVEVLGETGVVGEISGRTTAIDTLDGRRIRIPNHQVLNGPIANLTERRGRRSNLRVGVEYGTDLDRARTVILTAIADTETVLPEPAPEALVTEFGDSAVTFLLWFWHEPVANGTFRVVDEVARAVDRALRREGIVIPLPQRVVRRAHPDADGENDGRP